MEISWLYLQSSTFKIRTRGIVINQQKCEERFLDLHTQNSDEFSEFIELRRLKLREFNSKFNSFSFRKFQKLSFKKLSLLSDLARRNRKEIFKRRTFCEQEKFHEMSNNSH